MSIPGRPPKSLALLAFVALLAVGCPGPPPKTDVILPEVVIVSIDYDAATGKATVLPKQIRLKEDKQFVKWVSCDGEVEVEFDPADTPFEHTPTAKAAGEPARATAVTEAAAPQAALKHSVVSEKPKKGSHRDKPYSYKAFLTPTGGKKVEADPMIFVDP